MSTRAASACTSRRAKQKLVQLLFGPKYSGGGPESHRLLDSSIYSYTELRTAYLEKLQAIHPDKFAHRKRDNLTSQDKDYIQRIESKSEKESRHVQFVELQEAWKAYDGIAKMMKRGGSGSELDANFTMFGVGCSFADSPLERDLRNQITDQACRGWFSSGAIPNELTGEAESKSSTSNDHFFGDGGNRIALSDDDMFVLDKGATENKAQDSQQKGKSLIKGWVPGNKSPLR